MPRRTSDVWPRCRRDGAKRSERSAPTRLFAVADECRRALDGDDRRSGQGPQAVYEAIPRLVEAGVLQQTTIRRRNRAFEAADLIEAFTDLHRAQVPVPPYLTVSVPSIPPCRCPGTEQ
jgi:hypothetical protein